MKTIKKRRGGHVVYEMPEGEARQKRVAGPYPSRESAVTRHGEKQGDKTTDKGGK